ncbi:hypothetical protein D3C85_1230740 [compost metagenome]
MPIAVHTDIQDARIDGSNGGVIQPQARHGLRPDVVDEHVGIRGEPQQRLAAIGLLEVQHHAALAAIGVQEDATHAGIPAGPDAAHRVAAGRLDLDDVGAQVAEDLGGIGPHQHRGHVDDAHTVEGSAHGAPWLFEAGSAVRERKRPAASVLVSIRSPVSLERC